MQGKIPLQEHYILYFRTSFLLCLPASWREKFHELFKTWYKIKDPKYTREGHFLSGSNYAWPDFGISATQEFGSEEEGPS